MANIFTYVPYPETGYFSHLASDYASEHPDIHPFYRYAPTKDGLAEAIAQRSKYPINRKLLVDALTRQYENTPKHEKTEANILSLANENTYTVCSAHQPNLLTGYLYFIYKILHAIKLAEELNDQYPDKHFVPVYYMGSEDNDLEELGTFRFRGDKYVWDGDGQKGAVGRMTTKSLKGLLEKMFKVFGPPGANCERLQKIITNAYLGQKTIGCATQHLVNELFGQYGLVVLDPDDAALKSTFIPMMEDELRHQRSHEIISQQVKLLEAHYKIQANPRELNLFYLIDGLRERIEKKDNKWSVVNSGISWTEDEVVKELHEHPERFSPNVMLRGLYQETILPDVAFIGGGAEVAYWLQLKTVFAHYNIFYPAILLRQSVLWIPAAQTKLRQELGFDVSKIFKEIAELEEQYTKNHTAADLATNAEKEAIKETLNALKQKATAVDATLELAVEAAMAKIKHQLVTVEKKMLRAEKKKMEVQMQRIMRLKNALFPNSSLQERVENFAEYYLEYGPAWFDTIKDGIKPLDSRFLVIE